MCCLKELLPYVNSEAGFSFSWLVKNCCAEIGPGVGPDVLEALASN